MTDRCDGDCGLDGDPGNRSAVLQRLDLPPTSLVAANQVHGTSVVVATLEHAGCGAGSRDGATLEADAIVTNTPNLPIGIFVADCVPIWLYDPITRAGGLVHAGWRGTIARCAEAAINSLHQAFQTRPGDVVAHIGPCAGPEAYETSPAIARQFLDSELVTRGRCLDLAESNARVLLAAGLQKSNITFSRICTILGGRFYSFRATGASERNMAIFAIEEH